jgi:hypothetical protein
VVDSSLHAALRWLCDDDLPQALVGVHEIDLDGNAPAVRRGVGALLHVERLRRRYGHSRRRHLSNTRGRNASPIPSVRLMSAKRGAGPAQPRAAVFCRSREGRQTGAVSSTGLHATPCTGRDPEASLSDCEMGCRNRDGQADGDRIGGSGSPKRPPAAKNSLISDKIPSASTSMLSFPVTPIATSRIT